MNEDEQLPDDLRYQERDADGMPFMSIHAHPSTSGEVLIEMLENAIQNIKKEITRVPAKVLNLDQFRIKGE
jgi:hypothetical protein